jgi:hypothetical protein
MHCSDNTIWLNDAPDADPRWDDHLASCASCRAEVDRITRLRQAMQALPRQNAPAEVGDRLQQLLATTDGRRLGCDQTQEWLEPYREGLLTVAETFLVDDHLLWCPSCAAALEIADGLSGALRTLPQLVPPDSIAERVALGRLPWWQRLWTSPAPSWSFGRVLQTGGAMAAAALLFAVMFNSNSGTGGHIADKDAVDTGMSLVSPVPPEKTISSNVEPLGPPRPENLAVFGSFPVGDGGKSPATVIETEQEVATAPAPSNPETNRMPTPMSKALPLLPGFRPEAGIQPRGGVPKDRPVEAMVSMPPDEPWRRPKPEPVVVASAREALLNINREEALARSEEELSSLPDTLKLAAAFAYTEPSRPAGPAPLPAASTVEVSRSFANDLKRNAGSASMTPIVVKSDRSNSHNSGVLFNITLGSDG